MKLLSLQAVNNKAITYWEQEFKNGESVMIAGPTGQGKTTRASLLWSIMAPGDDQLRHGAKKGYAKAVLGDGQPEIIATRTFSKANMTGTISVERVDGAPIGAKQFVGMISDLAFDPHKIARLKGVARVDKLLASADLHGVDLKALDLEIAKAEQVRLDAFRKSELMEPGIEPAKVTPVDVSAISAEIQQANDHNAKVAAKEAELARALDAGKAAAATIKEREERVAQLRAELSAAEDALKLAINDRTLKAAAYTTIQTDLKAMIRKDTAEAQARLDGATEINRKANAWQTWKDKRAKQEEQDNIRASADEEVKSLRAKRKAALEGAGWPLPGVSIEGEDITYNGVLFDNLGESERQLVCGAIVIKDVLDHPIHVVRMDGLESMGKADRTALFQLYEKHGIQIMSTIVCEGPVPDGAITITECQPDEAGKQDEGKDE